jgi:hypothetical protein
MPKLQIKEEFRKGSNQNPALSKVKFRSEERFRRMF